MSCQKDKTEEESYNNPMEGTSWEYTSSNTFRTHMDFGKKTVYVEDQDNMVYVGWSGPSGDYNYKFRNDSVFLKDVKYYHVYGDNRPNPTDDTLILINSHKLKSLHKNITLDKQ